MCNFAIYDNAGISVWYIERKVKKLEGNIWAK